MDYLSEVSNILEALSVAREKINDEDIVLLVMGGIGDEYDLIVQNVSWGHQRGEKVTYQMRKGMLLDFENHQNRNNASQSECCVEKSDRGSKNTQNMNVMTIFV